MSDTTQIGEQVAGRLRDQSNTIDFEVREFLRDNFIVDADLMRLPGSASLTDSAVLDSMGVLEFVMFLEEHYRIEISDQETVPDNLDTIDNAVRFIQTKLNAQDRANAERG